MLDNEDPAKAVPVVSKYKAFEMYLEIYSEEYSISTKIRSIIQMNY